MIERSMKRNVKTYNGMSVSAFAGTSFRFMPSVDVEFLKENPSNNLYISKLFILSLSLSRRGRRPRASRYPFFTNRQDRGGLFSPFVHTSEPARSCLHLIIYTTSRIPEEGGHALWRHTTWQSTMPVCRRTFSCNPKLNKIQLTI